MYGVVDWLTNKEINVLKSMANGDRSIDTSKKTGYAVKSLETIRLRMYRKLGAKNAPHAVAIGYQKNIL